MIMEENFFKYFVLLLPNMITKMSWLWFLLALFLDSMINYPLLKWTQRRYAGEPITLKEDGLTLLGNLLLHMFWAVFLLLLSRDEFLSSLLPMVLILTLNQVLFHIIPWKLVKNRENGYKYSYYLRLIGVLSVILLCVFRDGYNEGTIYSFLCMINFDIVFMTQGIIDQTYRLEQ